MLEHDDAGERNLRLALKKLQDMTEYCETTTCRRKYLLNYFGEEYPEENCASCDNCDHPPDMIDGTEAATLIVTCLKQLPSRFGIELISDVLRGSKTTKIHDYHLNSLSAYGSGKKYSKAQYRTWINELVRQGYLDRAGDKYPVICCAGKSEELLKGRARVMLPVPERETTKRPAPAAIVSASAEDGALFLRLKSLRKAIADRNGVPPYVIFPDKSLHEMACARPGDRESFSLISGVGEYKLEKYGPEFMEEIRKG